MLAARWFTVRVIAVLAVLLGTLSLVSNAASASEPPGIEFFEQRIRPLFTQHCHECHGPSKQEAGLRLDLREAALAGSAQGPVLVPGDPAASKLLQAVGYEGDVQMPPQDRLSDEQIAALHTWIEVGCPWPADAEAAAPPTAPASIERARATHWAYQPLPEVPTIETPAESSQASDSAFIDELVRAGLATAGLQPSPMADRRTLLRRAKFDLLGLPPSVEEIEAFEADSSHDAFARVVEGYLASPHYGERWARHWLDVARYADTKGYVFTDDGRYPYAYTYRDYVVRALNDDLPFDRFVHEQLAADRLVAADRAADPQSLAALGFLTLGRRFSNNLHDIIDDRIDVVTRGLLGLSVTCARCHDHKYDPIPTDDYYSLYGVLASSVEPAELPLVGRAEENEAYRKFVAELTPKQQALDAFVATHNEELRSRFRRDVGRYLLAAVEMQSEVFEDKDTFLSLAEDELRPEIVRKWRTYLQAPERASSSVMGLWALLAELPEEGFAAAAADLLAGSEARAAQAVAAAPGRVLAALRLEPLASMSDVARRYGEVLAAIDEQWRQALAAAPELKALADAGDEALRQVLYAADSPTQFAIEDLYQLLDRDDYEQYGKLKAELEGFKAQDPGAPPRAMALVDTPQPVQPVVFVRGNPHRPGAEVPRHFLAVLSGAQRPAFSEGSGRLELARAITAHPLAARVIANRVWLHHFGQGLVRSPSDFGARGEEPTHRELLDALAAALRADGWSLKRLHRRIMLSATYQQASRWREEAVAVDPENRLLWRYTPRRLEYEALRDALLAVSGSLDLTMGGRSVDLHRDPAISRRTLYGYLDRQDLPQVLRAFDFASPDVSTAQRPATTVPQQALWALNAPLVRQQAQRLAEHGNLVAAGDEATRVDALFRLALARSPRPEERQMASEYLAAEQASLANLPPAERAARSWQRLAQAVLASNEFTFID